MRKVGYYPDHKSFGAFLLSEQARKPAIKAAFDIAAIAKASADRSTPGEKGAGDGTHLADRYQVNPSTAPVVLAGNPRVGAEVFNDSIYAARYEFGDAEGVGRVQAGNHGPGSRNLRKAGGKVGEMRGEPG